MASLSGRRGQGLEPSGHARSPGCSRHDCCRCLLLLLLLLMCGGTLQQVLSRHIVILISHMSYK